MNDTTASSGLRLKNRHAAEIEPPRRSSSRTTSIQKQGEPSITSWEPSLLDTDSSSAAEHRSSLVCAACSIERNIRMRIQISAVAHLAVDVEHDKSSVSITLDKESRNEDIRTHRSLCHTAITCISLNRCSLSATQWLSCNSVRCSSARSSVVNLCPMVSTDSVAVSRPSIVANPIIPIAPVGCIV